MFSVFCMWYYSNHLFIKLHCYLQWDKQYTDNLQVCEGSFILEFVFRGFVLTIIFSLRKLKLHLYLFHRRQEMMKNILSTERTDSKIINNISLWETTILDSLVIDNWLNKTHASFFSISPFSSDSCSKSINWKWIQ